MLHVFSYFCEIFRARKKYAYRRRGAPIFEFDRTVPSGHDRKKRPFFAKMSVSRAREGRFRVRAETPFFNSGEGQLAFFVPWRRRELQKWGSAGVEKGPISGVHFAPMSVSRRRERDFGEKRTNCARLSKKRCGDKPQSGPRRTPPKCRSVNTLQHF